MYRLFRLSVPLLLISWCIATHAQPPSRGAKEPAGDAAFTVDIKSPEGVHISSWPFTLNVTPVFDTNALGQPIFTRARPTSDTIVKVWEYGDSIPDTLSGWPHDLDSVGAIWEYYGGTAGFLVLENDTNITNHAPSLHCHVLALPWNPYGITHMAIDGVGVEIYGRQQLWDLRTQCGIDFEFTWIWISRDGGNTWTNEGIDWNGDGDSIPLTPTGMVFNQAIVGEWLNDDFSDFFDTIFFTGGTPSTTWPEPGVYPDSFWAVVPIIGLPSDPCGELTPYHDIVCYQRLQLSYDVISSRNYGDGGIGRSIVVRSANAGANPSSLDDSLDALWPLESERIGGTYIIGRKLDWGASIDADAPQWSSPVVILTPEDMDDSTGANPGGSGGQWLSPFGWYDLGPDRRHRICQTMRDWPDSTHRWRMAVWEGDSAMARHARVLKDSCGMRYVAGDVSDTADGLIEILGAGFVPWHGSFFRWGNNVACVMSCTDTAAVGWGGRARSNRLHMGIMDKDFNWTFARDLYIPSDLDERLDSANIYHCSMPLEQTPGGVRGKLFVNGIAGREYCSEGEAVSPWRTWITYVYFADLFNNLAMTPVGTYANDKDWTTRGPFWDKGEMLLLRDSLAQSAVRTDTIAFAAMGIPAGTESIRGVIVETESDSCCNDPAALAYVTEVRLYGPSVGGVAADSLWKTWTTDLTSVGSVRPFQLDFSDDVTNYNEIDVQPGQQWYVLALIYGGAAGLKVDVRRVALMTRMHGR